MHKWWMAGMLALGGGVGAQMSVVPSTLLETIFKSPKLEEKWFSKEFLKGTGATPAQIQAYIDQLKVDFGAYKSLKQESEYNYTVELEKAFLPVQFRLNAQGQVSGFLFKNPQMKSQNLQEALEGFKALSGTVSVFVSKNGKPILEMNADKPLAVGSAFKLAVLKALNTQIQAGKLSWDKTVVLEANDKSLPSGMLQDWPNGSRLTVETLASLMISISDNTATDTLIRVLGRENIEKDPSLQESKPLMTTRELFTLKNPKNADLLARYQLATATEKYAILKNLTARPLNIKDFADQKAQTETDWMISTEKLCSLMSSVADLPLMSINPGVADPQNWAHVAYKGGSEIGILNLTTQLKSKTTGDIYCVSVTWNDDRVLEESKLTPLYNALFGFFK